MIARILTSAPMGQTARPEVLAPDATSRPILWLNLLCLDAPLVAVAWQWVFARSAHITTTPAQVGALFLTAWLIYLVDRLADSIWLPTNVAPAARKAFCAAHRSVWMGAIAAIALADLAIVGRWLDGATLSNGIFLGLIAGVYLVTNVLFGRVWRMIPIKEIVIGILFATGTLLVLVESPATPSWSIVLAASFFAALCFLNCISIAVWERDLDQARGQSSIATRWPRIGVSIPFASFGLTVIACILAIADHSVLAPAICIGLSAALLAALHFVPSNRDQRTALADLVLLTPLFFLILERTW